LTKEGTAFVKCWPTPCSKPTLPELTGEVETVE